MSAPKRGLGKGLGALLGDRPVAVDAPGPAPAASGSGSGGVERLAVTRIKPNPDQPRRHFDPAGIDELRASIAELGVIVPVIVRRAGDGYELIAGERRWRAAQAAGLETIPALVREADDRASLELAIVENLQRVDLDPVEEAMGFAHLMESHELTQAHVAQRVGKSQPAVANALRLLALPDEIKALLRDHRISAGHARALLALPPERRAAVARRIVDEGLSVRAVERMATPKAKRAAAPARTDADEAAALERLRFRYATRVEFVPSGAGGTIALRYTDRDDLSRIVELLLGEPS